MVVRYNVRVVDDFNRLREHPDVLDRAMQMGQALAERARVLAPKRTGRLSRSIHPQIARDPVVGLHVRVSWEKKYYWGLFQELGTEHHPPHPFLRPAAAEFGADAHPNF